jgi:ubiquinone/menaquinone biosynthesis C-methylase UbiE
MIKTYFDNQIMRGKFVQEELAKITPGSRILDAGAGSQQYRKYCSHLEYVAQDFGKVTVDQNKGFTALSENYKYGPLDYICDITNIPAPDESFDAVICTEVFEHIPDPQLALKELTRLIKPGGILILTIPSNCLRHFDPYFFYSGFSDRWLEYWFKNTGLKIIKINIDGNYFKWIAVELARTCKQNLLATPFLFLALIWFYFRSKAPSSEAIATLCAGYHVVGRKINTSSKKKFRSEA